MDYFSLNGKENVSNTLIGEMHGEEIFPEGGNNFQKDDVVSENDFTESNSVYFIQPKPGEVKKNSISEMNEQSIIFPKTQDENKFLVYSKEPVVKVTYNHNKKMLEEKKNGKNGEKNGKNGKRNGKKKELETETGMEIEDVIENEEEFETEEELLDGLTEEENSSNTKSEKNRKKKRDDHKRKRIKSDLCNHLIEILNKKLELINPYYYFEKIPQCEVTDVSIKENKKILNFTLKELLSYKAFEKIPYTKLKNEKKELEREKKRERNKKEFEHNTNILNLLEEKGFKELDNILNGKMKDIYEEYLDSEIFQNSIEELRREGKYYDYIYAYLIISKNLLRYYKVEK